MQINPHLCPHLCPEQAKSSPVFNKLVIHYLLYIASFNLSVGVQAFVHLKYLKQAGPYALMQLKWLLTLCFVQMLCFSLHAQQLTIHEMLTAFLQAGGALPGASLQNAASCFFPLGLNSPTLKAALLRPKLAGESYHPCQRTHEVSWVLRIWHWPPASISCALGHPASTPLN